MNRFLSVLAVAASTWVFSATAETPREPINSISLNDALKMSLNHNPQLRGYQFRHAALVGEQKTAALRPEMRIHSELENIAGSGNYAGMDAAELTLSFSSVLELGDQRDSRMHVVTARQAQLASEERMAVLDLVAAVNYRFVALLGAQERLTLQLQTQQLAQSLVATLAKRVQAGRAPQEELLRARAALAKTTLQTSKAEQHVQIESLKLSAYWGTSTPNFTHAQGDLYALTTPAPLTHWLAQLQQNPDTALLAEESRLRAAELRKLEAEGQLALGWSAGIRQFQSTDETAVVVGVSIPLASGKRASGAIHKAHAEEEAARMAITSSNIQLASRLQQTYKAHTQALAELHSLRDQILPLQAEASHAIATAFEQGRYSSLELALAQRELLDTRIELIDTALRAHETRIELERLTASAPLTELPQ